MGQTEDALSRIERKLDTMNEATSLLRERMSRSETWQEGHVRDHTDDNTRMRWVLGLIATTFITSLSTAAIVLLH